MCDYVQEFLLYPLSNSEIQEETSMINIIKTTTEDTSYFALVPNCGACACTNSSAENYTINTANYRMNGTVSPYSNEK